MSKYDSITIYKIYLTDDPTINYIGSTVLFGRRKSQHRKNTYNRCGKHYNQPLYQFIRQMGGWDKFTMENLGSYPTTCKEDRHKIEAEFIKNHDSKINVMLINNK